MLKKNMLLLTIVMLLLVCGCEKIKENTASIGNDSIMFENETFKQLLDENKILSCEKDANSLTISLSDGVPEDLEIKGQLLDLKAEQLYDMEMDIKDFQVKDYTIIIHMDPDILYAVSSDYDVSKKSLLGFILKSEEKNTT